MTPKEVDYSTKTLAQLEAMNVASEGKLSLDTMFMAHLRRAANTAEYDREKAAREKVSGIADNIRDTMLEALSSKLPALWEKAQGQTANLKILDDGFGTIVRLVLSVSRRPGGEFAGEVSFRDPRKPKNHADGRQAA